jgi:hypothetical protein
MAQPCRILTDAEVADVATFSGVPAQIVAEHLQDPYYCVWHEENVVDMDGLKEKATRLFSFCTFDSSKSETHCVHHQGE